MTPVQLQAVSDGYSQRINYEAWLFGLYTQSALTAVLSAAFAKRGHTPAKYPSEPYSLGEAKSEQDKERLAENERLKSILYFKNWARATQKKFGK